MLYFLGALLILKRGRPPFSAGFSIFFINVFKKYSWKVYLRKRYGGWVVYKIYVVHNGLEMLTTPRMCDKNQCHQSMQHEMFHVNVKIATL